MIYLRPFLQQLQRAQNDTITPVMQNSNITVSEIIMANN